MLLFFDTETTGIYGKPYLVQLAAILTENDGILRGSCNLIIKPDGYTIPDEVVAFHGITTGIAQRSGVPLSVAIAVFNNLAVTLTSPDSQVIAHNKNYDLQIINYCYERGGWPSRLEGVSTYCTMDAMTRYCKLPPTEKMLKKGMSGYKSPRLSEAYEFAFNKPLEGAHDALYDVQACRDLYFWIKKKESPLCPTPDPAPVVVLDQQKIDDDQSQPQESDLLPTSEVPAS